MGVTYRARRLVLAAIVLAAVGAASCRGGGLAKQYEYEEDIHLSLDGSATVYINASLPALANLRGLELDLRPNARFDKNVVRKYYDTAESEVVRISSWRRFGRRFASIRLLVRDIRALATSAPLSWSTYGLTERDGLVVYRQVLGAVAGKDVGNVGWKGNELIAVRLHLPARIRYHNAGKDNLKRGNILVWEQTLAARQTGSPLEIEARMDTQSILFSTLKLFALSGAIALTVFALIVTWVVRKGRGRQSA